MSTAQMLEDDYDERLAKEVLDNWSIIRLAAFNTMSKTASSKWAAIEERIGAFTENTSAHDRYRNLIAGLNAVDNGKIATFSFRPPSAEASFRSIQRLSHEAKAEREMAELEFALALFERCRHGGRSTIAQHAATIATELREINPYVRNIGEVMQLVNKSLTV